MYNFGSMGLLMAIAMLHWHRVLLNLHARIGEKHPSSYTFCASECSLRLEAVLRSSSHYLVPHRALGSKYG